MRTSSLSRIAVDLTRCSRSAGTEPRPDHVDDVDEARQRVESHESTYSPIGVVGKLNGAGEIPSAH